MEQGRLMSLLPDELISVQHLSSSTVVVNFGYQGTKFKIHHVLEVSSLMVREMAFEMYLLHFGRLNKIVIVLSIAIVVRVWYTLLGHLLSAPKCKGSSIPGR